VIADTTTGAFGVVAIGAGAHGVNLHVDASALLAVLDADVADVTRQDEPAATP
jgi:prolyl-tRNA editing enzyme YbaK/EbsC (Cys-tRNA(Pro) deacylase)